MQCGECGYDGGLLEGQLNDANAEIERLKERVNDLADALDDFDKTIGRVDLTMER